MKSFARIVLTASLPLMVVIASGCCATKGRSTAVYPADEPCYECQQQPPYQQPYQQSGPLMVPPSPSGQPAPLTPIPVPPATLPDDLPVPPPPPGARRPSPIQTMGAATKDFFKSANENTRALFTR